MITLVKEDFKDLELDLFISVDGHHSDAVDFL